MKKTRLILLIPIVLAFACNDDDPILPIEDQDFQDLESEWIRIQITDSDNAIHMLDPVHDEIQSLAVDPIAEGSNNYLSSTGRYITSIDRAGGVVRFFDSGLENHGDHGHEHEAKWLQATAEVPLPTHYSSTSGHIVIFNDGDGSVTYARESSMDTPSFSPTTFPGDPIAHHGAATWLQGGVFAVTFKDESVPGSLPQWVKILDAEGNMLKEDEAVWVSGIHGDASNGTFAIFGAKEGIVMADREMEIGLVSNIEPLNTEDGNWMGTVKGHDALDVFYGWSRNQGIFRIDPGSNNMSATYLGNDVKNYFFNADGSKLILHKTNHEIVIFNAQTGEEINKTMLSIAESSVEIKDVDESYQAYRVMNEEDPVLTASSRFLYILDASRTSISARDLESLDLVEEFEVPRNIVNITRMGY